MSLLKADTIKPVTSSGDLSLQGDSGGSAVDCLNITSAGDINFTGNTDAKIKLPSAGGLYESDGSTAILTESGGAVTLDNVTLGSGVALPAASIVQTLFVQFSGVQTIGNGSSTGKTFVNIGTGVSGQEFSLVMAVSSGNKVIGMANVILTGDEAYGAVNVYYDSTQIAMADADGSRTRVTGGSQHAGGTNYEISILHETGISFNYTPGDTSEHTYTIRAGNIWSDAALTYINRVDDDGNSADVRRGISHFILMEVNQ